MPLFLPSSLARAGLGLDSLVAGQSPLITPPIALFAYEQASPTGYTMGCAKSCQTPPPEFPSPEQESNETALKAAEWVDLSRNACR